MKVFTSVNEEYCIENNTVLALGTFDGLHIAHKHVIDKVVEIAKQNNLLSVVYTFSNHPKDMNPSIETPKRLILPDQKIEFIEALGVDILIIVPFDEEQINIEAEDFLREIIVKKVKAKHIVVGYDFRFGKNARGCVNMLKEKSKVYGYEVDIIEPIRYDGIIVSSTIIRNYLLSGKVQNANNLLGREYSIKGKVIKGKQIGRKLGFPTINLYTEYEMTVLKPGVYATRTKFGDKIYHSITNVGFNPTFDQTDFNIETYILDYEGDLYDSEVEVLFEKYIRQEIKFGNLDDLMKQIDMDVLIVKEFFNI